MKSRRTAESLNPSAVWSQDDGGKCNCNQTHGFEQIPYSCQDLATIEEVNFLRHDPTLRAASRRCRNAFSTIPYGTVIPCSGEAGTIFDSQLAGETFQLAVQGHEVPIRREGDRTQSVNIYKDWKVTFTFAGRKGVRIDFEGQAIGNLNELNGTTYFDRHRFWNDVYDRLPKTVEI